MLSILFFLNRIGDALDVAVDALVLELHHGGKIELGITDLDAHAGERVPGLLEQLGGMQQGLRGNAAHIEAGAPQGGILLHHRHLHAELRRPDGADIAAGTGADDDEIVGHRGARQVHRSDLIERSKLDFGSSASQSGRSDTFRETPQLSAVMPKPDRPSLDIVPRSRSRSRSANFLQPRDLSRRRR